MGMLKGYKISENMSILIMSKTEVIMKDVFFPEAPLNSLRFFLYNYINSFSLSLSLP